MEAGRYAPGVGQRRMSQDAAERCAQIRVAAKLPRGGEANQDRQNNKRRRAAHIQHDIERVIRINPAVGFNHPQQAHQQTRGHDRRDNRHEDVGEQTRDTLERVQLAGCNIRRFRFTGLANPCRLNKRGVNLIHHPCAEDHLHLPGISKTAFHAFNLADSLLVGKRIIDQHQTKARGAMCRAGNVLFATEQRNKLARNMIKIHRYLFLTSFYDVRNAPAMREREGLKPGFHLHPKVPFPARVEAAAAKGVIAGVVIQLAAPVHPGGEQAQLRTAEEIANLARL